MIADSLPVVQSGGSRPTRAQRESFARFCKLYGSRAGKLGAPGKLTGFCSIYSPRFDPETAPTLDVEGYCVAWCGFDRGWRRIGSPIDPEYQEVLFSDV